jgi:chromosome segregation ATPase
MKELTDQLAAATITVKDGDEEKQFVLTSDYLEQLNETFAEQLAASTEQLNELQSAFASKEKEVDDLNGQLEAAQEKVEALKAKVIELGGEIGASASSSSSSHGENQSGTQKAESVSAKLPHNIAAQKAYEARKDMGEGKSFREIRKTRL